MAGISPTTLREQVQSTAPWALAEDTPAGIKARASGKRIRCTSNLDITRLAQWPHVSSATREGHTIELRSADAEPLLRRLLDADPQLADIEVMPLSLEEALAALATSETITLEQAA